MYLAHAREGTLYFWQKKSYRDGFVKIGNERCGDTECCDIKRGLVMAIGQAVSRPCIEHTIFYYHYKSTDGLDCRKEYTVSIDSLVYSLESHGCSVSNAPLRIRGENFTFNFAFSLRF